MKLQLIRPGRDYRWAGSHSIALASLASVGRAAGHDVRIVDAAFSGLAAGEIQRAITEWKPDVVGMTAMTHEIPAVRSLAPFIKRSIAAWTILGGPHATALPSQTLLEIGDIDIIVAGEGERALAAILERLRATRPSFEGIRGICYRSPEGHVLFGGSESEELEGHEIPMPATGLYYTPGHFSRFPQRPYYLCCSRGCPFECSFCSHMLGRRVRWRDPGDIVEEWSRAVLDLKAQKVHVVDDIFFHRSSQCDAVLDGITRAGLHRRATFEADIHVNLVRPDVVRRARAAGCTQMNIGIESCDDAVLRRAHRPYTSERAIRAVRMVQGEGIRAHCYFILGLPGETHASIRRTLRAIVRMNPHSMGLGTLAPYPGTEVHAIAARGEGGLTLEEADWDAYDRYGGRALRHEGIAPWHLKGYQVLGYLGLYLSHGRVLDLIRYLRPRMWTALDVLRSG